MENKQQNQLNKKNKKQKKTQHNTTTINRPYHNKTRNLYENRARWGQISGQNLITYLRQTNFHLSEMKVT